MDKLESFQIFKRVVETKSFSAVATELGTTQPTISKVIQALERDLGVLLLRRSTRGLSVTIAGQKLYHSSAGLIDHYERVVSEVTSQKNELSGELRISASLAFARVILIPLLKDLETLHPELRLTFLLNDGYTDLIENNIDVAIRIGDLEDSSLRALKIGNSTRSLYASKSYLQEKGRPRNTDELGQHRLLYFTRWQEKPSWSLKEKNGKSRKYFFDPFIKTDGSDLMREAILAGLGIAMMPTWLMVEPEKNKMVDRLFDEASARPVAVQAVSASGRELTLKQRAFIEFLSQRFEKIPSLSIRR